MLKNYDIYAGYASFFTAGFTIAAWAPLIPFVNDALQVGPMQFGMLLLMLGVGSVLGMPLAGWLSSRLGSRLAIALSGYSSCFVLVLLAWAPSYLFECCALFCYGVSLGCLEVSSNLYGAALEKNRHSRQMSGMHAFYSIGEVAAAICVSLALSLGFDMWSTTAFWMLALSLILSIALPHVSSVSLVSEQSAPFALPKGPVIMLAGLCAVVFLAEGAMLDWSALFLQEHINVPLEHAGVGYTVFVIAMAIARLVGDRIVTQFGAVRVVWGGAALMVGALTSMVMIPTLPVSLISLFAMGLGIANVAPLIISAASRQKRMPALPAVTAVTTIGYFGLMAGPAILGVISEYTSIAMAFLFIAALLTLAAWWTRSVRYCL